MLKLQLASRRCAVASRVAPSSPAVCLPSLHAVEHASLPRGLGGALCQDTRVLLSVASALAVAASRRRNSCQQKASRVRHIANASNLKKSKAKSASIIYNELKMQLKSDGTLGEDDISEYRDESGVRCCNISWHIPVENVTLRVSGQGKSKKAAQHNAKGDMLVALGKLFPERGFPQPSPEAESKKLQSTEPTKEQKSQAKPKKPKSAKLKKIESESKANYADVLRQLERDGSVELTDSSIEAVPGGFECKLWWHCLSEAVTIRAQGQGESEEAAQRIAKVDMLVAIGHTEVKWEYFSSDYTAFLKETLAPDIPVSRVCFLLLEDSLVTMSMWCIIVPSILSRLLSEGSMSELDTFLGAVIKGADKKGGIPLNLWEELLDVASFAVLSNTLALRAIKTLKNVRLLNFGHGQKTLEYYTHFRYLLSLEWLADLHRGVKDYEENFVSLRYAIALEALDANGKLRPTTDADKEELFRDPPHDGVVFLVPEWMIQEIKWSKHLIAKANAKDAAFPILSLLQKPGVVMAQVSHMKRKKVPKQNGMVSELKVFPVGLQTVRGAESDTHTLEEGLTYRLVKVGAVTTDKRMRIALHELAKARLAFRGSSTSFTEEMQHVLLPRVPLNADTGGDTQPDLQEEAELALRAEAASAAGTSLDELITQRPLLSKLNPEQRTAVESAIQNPITIIQGPPGTGKTFVSCSIMLAWLTKHKEGDKILAVAHSRKAAENIYMQLESLGVNCYGWGLFEDADESEDATDWSKELRQLYAADVVVATCIGSGAAAVMKNQFTRKPIRYQRVVIDEGTQANEPSCLVPLQHGSKQVVLIGDQAQLPATILSADAKEEGLNISLFERLLDAQASRCIMLREQRRMHSTIAKFPSEHFYESRLATALDDDRVEPIPQFPWPNDDSRVCFVDMSSAGPQEAVRVNSMYNVVEAKAVALVVVKLLQEGFPPGEIGVLAPYQAQVEELESRVKGEITRNNRLAAKGSAPVIPATAAKDIVINTVDGFQGSEKDLIIFSATRSNSRGRIGFLDDPRRMNVMLTRAKRGVIVFGCEDTLLKSKSDSGEPSKWSDWVVWARGMDLVLGPTLEKSKAEPEPYHREILHQQQGLSQDQAKLPKITDPEKIADPEPVLRTRFLEKSGDDKLEAADLEALYEAYMEELGVVEARYECKHEIRNDERVVCCTLQWDYVDDVSSATKTLEAQGFSSAVVADEEVVDGAEHEVADGLDEEAVDGADEEAVDALDDEVFDGPEEEARSSARADMLHLLGLQSRSIRSDEVMWVASLQQDLAQGQDRLYDAVGEACERLEKENMSSWVYFLPETLSAILCSGDEFLLGELNDALQKSVERRGGMPIHLWEKLLDAASFTLRHIDLADSAINALKVLPHHTLGMRSNGGTYLAKYRPLLAMERLGGTLSALQSYHLDRLSVKRAPTVEVRKFHSLSGIGGEETLVAFRPVSKVATQELLQGDRCVRRQSLVLLVPDQPIGDSEWFQGIGGRKSTADANEVEVGLDDSAQAEDVGWCHPDAWMGCIADMSGGRFGEALDMWVSPTLAYRATASALLKKGDRFRLFALGPERPTLRMVEALRSLCIPGLRQRYSFHDDMTRLLLGSHEGCESAAMLATKPVIEDADEFLGTFLEDSPDFQHLNPSQLTAVKRALEQPLSIIQGPPGTGKTFVACAIVAAWIERHGQDDETQSILAVAHSNVAADNLHERLTSLGIDSARLSSGIKKQGSEDDGQDALTVNWAHIRRADVVVATCIGSGKEGLEKVAKDEEREVRRFQRVILDEGTQATEPSAILALGYSCEQLVLIGDQAQLPATVLSAQALKAGLGESLFERVVASEIVQPTLLNEQRRMHSTIADFPNKHFYKSRLVNAIDDSSLYPVYEFKWPNPDCRVCFIDLVAQDVPEKHTGYSACNPHEAECVAKVVRGVLERGFAAHALGVLTPYRAQIIEIRRALRNYGCDRTAICVDTVDGFQGMEKELIIFSSVRHNEKADIGFLADDRRMNVMLTRAKRGVIVVGNSGTLLNSGTTWTKWCEWAYDQNAATNMAQLAVRENQDAQTPDLEMDPNVARSAPIVTLLQEEKRHEAVAAACKLLEAEDYSTSAWFTFLPRLLRALYDNSEEELLLQKLVPAIVSGAEAQGGVPAWLKADLLKDAETHPLGSSCVNDLAMLSDGADEIDYSASFDNIDVEDLDFLIGMEESLGSVD